MINSSETYKKVELLKRKCGFHKVQQNAKSQGITSITLFLMIAWYVYLSMETTNYAFE